MGGDRETMSQQKVENKTGDVEVVGNVRYHESGGQVHFHDDKNGLKVAVPVATWFGAWQKMLLSLPAEWHFADTERNTIVNVKLRLKEAKPHKERSARLDALISIEKIELSEAFTALNKFSSK